MEQDQHDLPTPAAPNTSQRLHNEITASNNLTPPDLTLACLHRDIRRIERLDLLHTDVPTTPSGMGMCLGLLPWKPGRC
jgi:hypothetical protein